MNGERFGHIVRQLIRRPTSIAGIVLLLAFIAIAVMAPMLAPPADPTNPYAIPHIGYRPEPSAPNAEHIFGATERQYDVFYGVVWGTRTASRVGPIITFAALVIGLSVGSLAAYYGG